MELIELLPNYIKSIMYRYIYQELLNDVNKEYHAKFGVYWLNNRQFMSYGHIPMANWRKLPIKCSLLCIHKIKGNGIRVAYLPKNY